MTYGWVVWFGVCVVLAQDDPYCTARYERLCLGKGPHVACQYPVRGAGPACENYTAIIFSNDLKQFILHYVNRRRQKIASGHERVRGGVHLPKPEVMMLVQWDRELAYLAQRLADQCQFVHDDCRATVRYPYAGQTVGEVRLRRSGKSLERGARRTIGRVFDAWWGERRRVQAKQLISPFVLTSKGTVWGHFSQLAVWTLRAMGCGAVHHGSVRPRLLLVCDFSHTNMLGQRTISPGPLASCPPHTMRTARPYPLLCAPPPILSNQEIDDKVNEEEEEEEEESDEYEDKLDENEAESRPNLYKDRSENTFPTRPWPNRPVKPNQDELEDVDVDISSERQHKTIETVTVDIREKHRPADIPYQHFRQYRPVDTDSQSITDQRMIDDHLVSLQYSTTYTDYQPRQHKPGMGIDDQSVREHDTDNQSFEEDTEKQQYKTMDIYYQSARQQYTTMDSDIRPVQQYKSDSNQRLRPIQDVRHDARPMLNARPVQDIRPVKVLKPINDEDDVDYRYIRPIQVELDTDTEQKDDFVQTDNRPVVSTENDWIRNARPLAYGNDDVSYSARPIQMENGGNEKAKKATVTGKTVRVSVKYRENPEGLFRKKLNDELNTRSQDFENGEQDTRSKQSDGRAGTQARYRQLDANKPLQKAESHSSSEVRRKGEYKAYNAIYRKDQFNGRPLPMEPRQWKGHDMDLQDMTGVLPLRKQTHASVPQITTVVVYRPTSLYGIQTEAAIRHRWLQTRIRPRRPGATALLQNIPKTYSPQILEKKLYKPSLELDKDDEEQLYQDTGFKLSKNR